jgi:uncharacterized membrane protein
MARKGMIAGGIVLLILGVIIFFFSSFINSVQSNNMQQCNSLSGRLGQSLSNEEAQTCSRAPAYQSLGITGILLSVAMVVIGIVLIVVGAVKSKKAVIS